jgi:hypothetical protein
MRSFLYTQKVTSVSEKHTATILSIKTLVTFYQTLRCHIAGWKHFKFLHALFYEQTFAHTYTYEVFLLNTF